MLVVLDTNIWIDWLVFGDPSTATLQTAQRAGKIRIAIDAACRGELACVLSYPEFALDEAQRNAHLLEVDRCTVGQDRQPLSCSIALPRCADPDDQKFLELASHASADWLLTRDKALLKLRPRLRSVGVRIGSPGEWFAEFSRGG